MLTCCPLFSALGDWFRECVHTQTYTYEGCTSTNVQRATCVATRTRDIAIAYNTNARKHYIHTPNSGRLALTCIDKVTHLHLHTNTDTHAHAQAHRKRGKMKESKAQGERWAWNAPTRRYTTQNGRIYIYIHTYIHTYPHTYLHTDRRPYKHTYFYTFTHTYIHTHILTYIHT